MSESRPVPLRAVHPLTPSAPLEERADEELMVLACGDHRAAFEVLASRYLPRLTRYCAKVLGNPRTGEDLAQDVLVAAWVWRARYRPRARFQVFLFTVAHNRCRNRLRAETRLRRWLAGGAGVEQDGAVAAQSLDPGQLDALLEQERSREVHEALLAIPARLREAVLLRFDQGLEYADIARIVGRPESTVRSRVFHALKRLRAALAPGGEP